MDDEISFVEEMNQRLLITVTDTEQVPELQSISSRNDQESEPANISQWSLLFKLFLAITIMGACVACVSFIILITPTPPTVHVQSMHISFANHNLPVWSATFSIKNPNEKLHVTYQNPSVWLSHRGRLVSTVRTDSFGQKGGEENKVIVNGDETKVIDEEAAWEMEDEVAVTGGVVGFDIVFSGRVGFYPGVSALWGEQYMSAVCENVRTKLYNVDDQIYGTNRSVLSFDGRLDCRVRLPKYP
ncbi:uncharacterized protein LOC110226390 [Arabidopsis lyrata subsp. lyrata]|uniref:uncharacterized protein LOC110226390 n=1 Tax=Arabidopsis lyrata subsp. lyrata TaxID=81972 RepID=UPI000A29DEAC|nr:uncharacterized protein LOC110226390 [Arabidopsis lyrata subsp. lyrata]|eukprot:XP_020873698.1 uncharacterized protein LOC110226390 [Arabidopsis lyrata subsp. lyrata]